MNILFLPQNIASMPALTARAFNNFEGISAKCLTISVHKYQQTGSHVIVLPQAIPKSKPFKWLLYKYRFFMAVRKWIQWADIVHYTMYPVYQRNNWDLSFAAKHKKKIFVEWVGSDIRNPEFLKTINPYYAHAFENGYEYVHHESKVRSVKIQQAFAKYKAIPMLCAEMSLYLQKSIFTDFKLVYMRIDTKNFNPVYPDEKKTRPLILHSPTAKIAKGSNIIMPLLAELQKEYDFEYRMLNDLSRQEVLAQMQEADILIDQIILGSYGMATLEAMSFGKPVVCYIMPEVFEAGLSAECPVVNANPDNLKEQLINLITNPALRNETGRKSRAFVEKFHDVELVSKQMLAEYNKALDKGKANA